MQCKGGVTTTPHQAHPHIDETCLQSLLAYGNFGHVDNFNSATSKFVASSTAIHSTFTRPHIYKTHTSWTFTLQTPHQPSHNATTTTTTPTSSQPAHTSLTMQCQGKITKRSRGGNSANSGKTRTARKAPVTPKATPAKVPRTPLLRPMAAPKSSDGIPPLLLPPSVRISGAHSLNRRRSFGG